MGVCLRRRPSSADRGKEAESPLCGRRRRPPGLQHLSHFLGRMAQGSPERKSRRDLVGPLIDAPPEVARSPSGAGRCCSGFLRTPLAPAPAAARVPPRPLHPVPNPTPSPSNPLLWIPLAFPSPCPCIVRLLHWSVGPAYLLLCCACARRLPGSPAGAAAFIACRVTPCGGCHSCGPRLSHTDVADVSRNENAGRGAGRSGEAGGGGGWWGLRR